MNVLKDLFEKAGSWPTPWIKKMELVYFLNFFLIEG